MSYLLTNPKRGLNILTTLHEMLQDRKYQVTEPDAKKTASILENVVEAQTYYDSQEVLFVAQKDQHTIRIMNPKEEKLAIDTVRKYVERVENEGPLCSILIVIQNITPAARQIVQSCKQFEMFYEKHLYRNITKHVYYAPHTALSDTEEQAVLKQYKCDKDNFPVLLKSDAVARYFNWKTGTMVKTETRVGGASAPYITYRVVIDN
jgi:DNA-directed RNA polymerase subunit H (RpoH/RPB5)